MKLPVSLWKNSGKVCGSKYLHSILHQLIDQTLLAILIYIIRESVFYQTLYTVSSVNNARIFTNVMLKLSVFLCRRPFYQFL